MRMRPIESSRAGELVNCAAVPSEMKRSTSVARSRSLSEYSSISVPALEPAVRFHAIVPPGATSARMMSKRASADWPGTFPESCSVRPVRLAETVGGPSSTEEI